MSINFNGMSLPVHQAYGFEILEKCESQIESLSLPDPGVLIHHTTLRNGEPFGECEYELVAPSVQTIVDLVRQLFDHKIPLKLPCKTISIQNDADQFTVAFSPGFQEGQFLAGFTAAIKLFLMYESYFIFDKITVISSPDRAITFLQVDARNNDPLLKRMQSLIDHKLLITRFRRTSKVSLFEHIQLQPTETTPACYVNEAEQRHVLSYMNHRFRFQFTFFNGNSHLTYSRYFKVLPARSSWTKSDLTTLLSNHQPSPCALHAHQICAYDLLASEKATERILADTKKMSSKRLFLTALSAATPAQSPTEYFARNALFDRNVIPLIFDFLVPNAHPNAVQP